MCAETAHVLRFGLGELMELEVAELARWHEEAMSIAKAIYPAP